ncbi:MAG: DUF4845 domain-containing protein [Salinisphaera sp.]|jgi:hypothetical protein|nr:DUF4845 domain-containing protein [Salinisphaera sp.]
MTSQVNQNTQRGMTLWSLLYVLITLGLVGIVAVKSVPVYLNAYDVKKTLQDVASQPDMGNASARQIQNAVQKHFDAGYVSNITGRDVAVKQVGKHRELEVIYEVRRPLFFNMSMVYSFNEKVSMKGDGSE